MERYTLMQANQTKRVCNTCLQEKVLGTNFYRRYSYLKEKCQADGKWAYVNRCIDCTSKYQQKYEAEARRRLCLGKERLSDYRGYGTYEAYKEAQQKAVHTPCPICNTIMSSKGWNETCCIQRRDMPRSYPGFICRKCLNTIRHFKQNQKILDFMNFYEVPMENIPEKGYEVTHFKRRRANKDESSAS